MSELVPKLATVVVRHTEGKLSPQAQEDLVVELARVCLQPPSSGWPAAGEGRSRVIVSTIGKNRPGIVAAVSQVLAGAGADIIDINQTLVQDNFAMIMVADLPSKDSDLGALQEKLRAVARELGVQVFAQHEEIFRAMQRI